tara:strand:- start:2122 stop:2805 length:684 start_codon:yes stop_codon:yes gene_type:complete
MKIALCLSGQSRFLEKAYNEVIYPYLLNNNQVDVFIHSWSVDKEIIDGGFVNGGGHIMGEPLPPNHNDKVISLYNPTSHLIEPQIEFEYGKYPERTMPGIRSDYLYSQFYSVFKCNNLRKIYQTKTGIKYDWVVRSRFDIKLNTPINFNVDNTQLIIPNGCFNPNGYVDCFAMSNEKVMDVYCGLYNNIDYIMENTDTSFCGEFLLRKHLNSNNLSPKEELWHSLYR